MNRFRLPAWIMRSARRSLSFTMLLVIAGMLLSPLTSNLAIAQDAAPAEAPAETAPVESVPAEAPAIEQPVIQEPAAEPAPQEPVQPTPPPTGSLEIRLTSSTGVALSGLLAVYDASGAYHERWTANGVAWFSDLIAGQATVYQIKGTTDFAFDASASRVIDVPVGGNATLPLTNAFLDADNDGVGDSVDVCATGDDAVDADDNGTPDACDEVPSSDTPTSGTPAADSTPDESSEISASVAEEPVVVEEAPVTCQQADAVSPWVTTDLADYPPGSLVTLSGGDWVAGQVIEILVEDDGIADAERGSWNHATTVTADEQGKFTYQFTIAPWFVADYTVVATGECSGAETTFTDSVTSPECSQVGSSDDIRDNRDRWWVQFECLLHSGDNESTFSRSISDPTEGWLYSFDNTVTFRDKGAIVVRDGIPQQNVSSLPQLVVFLKPDPAWNNTHARVGQVTVTVSSTKDGVTTTTNTILEARDSSAPTLLCTPTVSITNANNTLNFAPSTWTGSSWSQVNGSLGLSVDPMVAAGCVGMDGTTIQVSADPMMNEDNTEAIPASAIAFVGLTGPLDGGTPGTLSDPLTIADIPPAPSGVSAGIDLTANFLLAPPDTAPTGTYIGTIYITNSAAGS